MATRWSSITTRALQALLAIAFVIGTLPLAATASAQETPAPGSEVIVVLEDGADPVAAARDMGVEVTHIYRHVFTGFSGIMPATPLEAPIGAARARKPAVKDISPDGTVQIEAQQIPDGVSRTEVPKDEDGQHLAIPSPVNAGIAILDTGIAETSGDLNIAGGYSCIGKDPNRWQDDEGHGTHVAGIAAAQDNAKGVVGVAPGARLWAVKVLNNKGTGSYSDVICGLDWVKAHSADIDVVNLSLSGPGETGSCEKPALHRAICSVVDAGITVVVAAGNQGTNANSRVPASYDEVITVSGIADSDGKPGALGPRPCYAKRDDRFLNFSNYGNVVDIAAPGGCILSYGLSGGLVEKSGTSEAAPHVAGAVANFIATEATHPSPDQVRAWLLTEASQSQAEQNVTGDPDSKQERKKAKKAKIKKARKKVKKAKSKSAKRKAKAKLRKIRQQKVTEGTLEPVLWLGDLPRG
ncbi:MAG: S8 family serine peptidase [Thermomicrobiales bacterium]|nr:S8 family serine peptidase [Thermomicrobiales bacterium]